MVFMFYRAVRAQADMLKIQKNQSSIFHCRINGHLSLGMTSRMALIEIAGSLDRYSVNKHDILLVSSRTAKSAGKNAHLYKGQVILYYIGLNTNFKHTHTHTLCN